MQPSDKTFYESLCSDLPDNRSQIGQVHFLPFVLMGFILGVLIGRKKRASVHRFMKNNHVFLCKATGFSAKKPISNPQLGRILRLLDIDQLNKLIYLHFGVVIDELVCGEWVAIDGKDLKGSIESQLSSRSDVLVHAVTHKNKALVAQDFYEGDKESEKLAVRKLLDASNLSAKSLTLDALHTDPTTLGQIEGQKGQYLVQVKDNQKELTKDLISKERRLVPLDNIIDLDKGHGRIEKRSYTFFDIQACIFDKRWTPCALSTLIVVNRHFEVLKTGKIMQEQSLYITNVSISQNTQITTKNLAQAIRGHWTIENVHQIRDVTFKEDNIRTTRGIYSKAYAIVTSLAIAALNKVKPQNFAELMDEFTDNKDKFLEFLRKIKML